MERKEETRSYGEPSPSSLPADEQPGPFTVIDHAVDVALLSAAS